VNGVHSRSHPALTDHSHRIVQNGLRPVSSMCHVPTYNIETSMLEPALSSRPRAIMVDHTLGNPFDLGAVTRNSPESRTCG